MALTYTFGNVSEALPNIMQNLLAYGDEVGSRNGRVKELLNAQIVITDPLQREVLSINRKANVFAQIAETVWVLSGRNDVEWLSAYLPRAMDYSDDGKVWRAGYGPRIREWEHGYHDIDQLAYVINTLREDPLSRQAVIGIWDPVVDTLPGKDRACNTQLQFQSRGGKLYLTVTVRSNDVMWGWSGINAFEWSTLQEIVASLLGIDVGDLTFNIGNLHLYQQHWEKARRIEYEPATYRPVRFNPGRGITTLEGVDAMFGQWFEWETRCRTGDVSPSDPDGWADPLIQSWAAAVAYYWTRDNAWLRYLEGTALAAAIARTPASVYPEPSEQSSSGVVGLGHNLAAHDRTGAFYEYVTNLHAVKHASYGNSWKKRGEQMSILANMARKVDRLGVGDEFDSSSDTVIDLLVYTIKYTCWLDGTDDGPDNFNQRLGYVLRDTEETCTADEAFDITFADIAKDFDKYADSVSRFQTHEKITFMSELALLLAPIARDIWFDEQSDDYLGADID